MKVISLIIFILLYSSLSYATEVCPEIKGQFECISQGEQLFITIDFKKTSISTTYIIDDYPVVADGKTRFYEDKNIKNGEVTGNCKNNSFQHHLLGNFINSKGETYGRVNLTSVFKPNKNQGLEIIQSGEYLFKEYGQIPIDNVIICLNPKAYK